MGSEIVRRRGGEGEFGNESGSERAVKLRKGFLLLLLLAAAAVLVAWGHGCRRLALLDGS